MDTKQILIIVASCLVAAFIFALVFRCYLKSYKGHNRFLLFLRYKIFRIKNKRQKYDAYYSVKPRFLSACEQEYFVALKKIVNERFFIFPQVPLSQLVEKHSKSSYRTELFRIVDFCIFDRDYYPLLCIEINDTSHLKKDRTVRDSKVSEILKSARIPLITFWTYEGIDEQEIRKQLKQYKIT